MKYNLNNLGNRCCKGNEGVIRKNIKHMNKAEVEYLKSMIKELNKLTISRHAVDKQLLNIEDIEKIIKDKKYQIIDYNYNISNKEERIMFRTKTRYNVKNTDGKIEECYCKIVISITTNCIITQWMNRVIDEKHKQDNLATRYYENFDIINKKVRI